MLELLPLNTLQTPSDRGGIKFMDRNKAVCLDFNYRPDSFPSVKVDATFLFRKRLLETSTTGRPSVFKATVNSHTLL